MARSKRPPRKQPPEPPRHAWRDSPIDQESKGLEDPSVPAESGTPSAHAFSLDFPATLTAIVRSEESGGFSAEVPALPGCFTEGETLEELRGNLQEAADGWLKAHQDLASAALFCEDAKQIEGR